MFEYHTFLHHSQTEIEVKRMDISFEYHTFLHHSQTRTVALFLGHVFEYHTFLHHSQTSKFKNAVPHPHRAWYSNIF